MEKVLATRLLKACIDLDEGFGELDRLVSTIPDEEERRLFAKGLGGVIGSVNDLLIRPIVRQHPHLDPDK